MLAIALIFVGVVILVRALFMSRAVIGERESFELTRRHKQAAVAIGASTGFVIGLTSAGSGTLIAVFLIAYYRMVPRNVVWGRTCSTPPSCCGRPRSPTSWPATSTSGWSARSCSARSRACGSAAT